MAPPNQHQLYGLRCQRCGNPLELPMDPQLLHIDCPACGQDNVLPPHLVQARQHQYKVQMAYQQNAHDAAARVAVAKSKSSTNLIIFVIVLVSGLLLCGGLGVLGWHAEREEEAAERRLADPAVNGQSLMTAQLNRMKTEQGCGRILVQPESQRGDPKQEFRISLNMVPNDHCVHVLATTGTNGAISLRHESDEALTKTLPPASGTLDYRLCATKKTTHAFFFKAPRDTPYTVASIECPRTPAEGGSRSKPDDPKTTGKQRAQELLSFASNAGCRGVLAAPKVYRGAQSFTLTLRNRAACYNMFATSHFADVRFNVELTDPTGKPLPVPRAAHEIRVVHCAQQNGDYKLKLTPSTQDHYATTSVVCPRKGPEGLVRERAMIREAR